MEHLPYPRCSCHRLMGRFIPTGGASGMEMDWSRVLFWETLLGDVQPAGHFPRAVGLSLERQPESVAKPGGRFAPSNHQHLLVISKSYRLFDPPNAQSVGLPVKAAGDRFIGLHRPDSRPP
jgi:hypothetical protein